MCALARALDIYVSVQLIYAQYASRAPVFWLYARAFKSILRAKLETELMAKVTFNHIESGDDG